jgi:hypothetical protein
MAETKLVGLPMETPILEMLARSEAKASVQKLTPAAQKLTKADLVALGGWGYSRNANIQELTVRDINSIKQVFANNMVASAGADSKNGISCCCCCCPCCCAVTVEKPITDWSSLKLVV